MPNSLCFLRIILTPIIIYFLSNQQKSWQVAFALYVFCALTDLFDGYIARKSNNITTLGTILDPLADKIFTLSILGYFVLTGIVSKLLFAGIAAREVSVSYLRINRLAKGYVFTPSPFAKAKTFFEMIAIGAIILLYGTKGEHIRTISNILVLLAFLLSIGSAIGYIKAMYKRTFEGYLRKDEGKEKTMVA